MQPSVSRHARLGPSGAYAWLQCPHTIHIRKFVNKGDTNPAALAGTIMHEVYERILNGGDHLREEEIQALDYLDFGEAYCRMIIDDAIFATRKLLTRYRVDEFITETLVDPGARIGREDLWGTADLIAANERRRTLIVGDLKTGRGKVEAFENKQMMLYALGALEEITFEPKKIILAIFQPPIYKKKASIWPTTVDKLLEFESHVAERAELTDLPVPPRNPSIAACRWCPGRFICPDAMV